MVTVFVLLGIGEQRVNENARADYGPTALDRTTTYTYAQGTENITRIDRPDGTNVQFAYDATYNKPTVEIDEVGNRTSHSAGTGELITTTDPLGKVTTSTWSSGRLESETDPHGQRTTYLYNTAVKFQDPPPM